VKVTRIHHASVNTHGTSLDAVRRFYGEVLGLPLAPRPDLGVDGSWYEAGPGGQVHVIDAPAAGAGIDPIGNHYCLAVDDLEAAAADLEQAGVEFFRLGDQVFLTDPGGNTIELQQDRPAGNAE
jgi:catechol 2,3-dioxygenase-like lactoylglutathione lyase family enzyme